MKIIERVVEATHQPNKNDLWLKPEEGGSATLNRYAGGQWHPIGGGNGGSDGSDGGSEAILLSARDGKSLAFSDFYVLAEIRRAIENHTLHRVLVYNLESYEWLSIPGYNVDPNANSFFPYFYTWNNEINGYVMTEGPEIIQTVEQLEALAEIQYQAIKESGNEYDDIKPVDYYLQKGPLLSADLFFLMFGYDYLIAVGDKAVAVRVNNNSRITEIELVKQEGGATYLPISIQHAQALVGLYITEGEG